MTKTYKIEVDCANCAEKMQEAAKKTEGRGGSHRKFYDPENEGGVCGRSGRKKRYEAGSESMPEGGT